MHLVGGHSEVHQVTGGRIGTSLTQLLVVAVRTPRVAVGTKFDLDAGPVLEELSHEGEGGLGLVPQIIAVVVPSDFGQFEAVSFPDGAGILVVPQFAGRDQRDFEPHFPHEGVSWRRDLEVPGEVGVHQGFRTVGLAVGQLELEQPVHVRVEGHGAAVDDIEQVDGGVRDGRSGNAVHHDALHEERALNDVEVEEAVVAEAIGGDQTGLSVGVERQGEIVTLAVQRVIQVHRRSPCSGRVPDGEEDVEAAKGDLGVGGEEEGVVALHGREDVIAPAVHFRPHVDRGVLPGGAVPADVPEVHAALSSGHVT